MGTAAPGEKKYDCWARNRLGFGPPLGAFHPCQLSASNCSALSARSRHPGGLASTRIRDACVNRNKAGIACCSGHAAEPFDGEQNQKARHRAGLASVAEVARASGLERSDAGREA